MEAAARCCRQSPALPCPAVHATARRSPLTPRLLHLRPASLHGCRLRGVPTELLTGCSSLATLTLHGNPVTAEQLRDTPGWAAFDERRKAKYDKQVRWERVPLHCPCCACHANGACSACNSEGATLGNRLHTPPCCNHVPVPLPAGGHEGAEPGL